METAKNIIILLSLIAIVIQSFIISSQKDESFQLQQKYLKENTSLLEHYQEEISKLERSKEEKIHIASDKYFSEPDYHLGIFAKEYGFRVVEINND